MPQALALYFFHYNFCRIHKSLRTSLAQVAGVTDELLSMADLGSADGRCKPAKEARAVQEGRRLNPLMKQPDNDKQRHDQATRQARNRASSEILSFVDSHGDALNG
jgi:hypothetical protein